ncbi:MAG TPA: hypothetical protein VFJ82_10660 [Longimicrobium sp.]|nr:hypothetical protein [Longimicrobium sp.]
MNKLSLELDTLAVESFETGAAVPLRGTVGGHRDPQPTPPVQVDCTCVASCLCPTSAFYCATVQQTAISCDYTFNDSCVYDTFSAGNGGVSVDVCIDTEVC